MGNFYGIPGVKYISHGEWSDPEVEYKGYTFNYWDVEDSLYDLFKQEFEPYEDDLYVSRDTGEVLSFEDWLNQNKDLVYGELDDFVAFSKYNYGDIADDDYFDDDGWEIDTDNYEYDYELNESKRINERQSDRSFIDYKETDFDNPDTEYAVTVWKNGETYGKTYYFDNFKEAKDFARDMRSRDDVDNVVVRKEIVYGREYDKAEYSTSDWLKYNSDDGEYYTPIGKDAHGELQFKKYSESKNRGKKKVSEATDDYYNRIFSKMNTKPVYAMSQHDKEIDGQYYVEPEESFYKNIEEIIDGGYEIALNALRVDYIYKVYDTTVYFADESDVSNEELIDEYSGVEFVPEDFGAGVDWEDLK